MSVKEFYREYWEAFAQDSAGPRRHTSDIPTLKHGKECYRKFSARWSGFMLVATANVAADQIGAQFFTGSAKGRAFVETLDPNNVGVRLRGGAIAISHVNNTDAKFEILWSPVQLCDKSFWPVQFLWLRIALNELAETLVPLVDRFAGDHA